MASWKQISFGVVTYLASLLVFVLAGESGSGKGFGDHIDWVKLDDAYGIAKESNKPIMLIIHKTWCGACKALKPKFAESKEIERLSKEFVMVNVEDDEEPSDSKFTPDGGYIPRILFLDADGNVNNAITNSRGNPKYKYYYPDPTGIIASMKSVVQPAGSKLDGTNDEL
ncbi:thioredoxin domain-containing protein 12-like [Amphiura filiformis]|uniref:thioredoxin domain-containing protein 12-like n=1 Tax=Amphiura filiformis TaxID=82378 RepID=UPI003B21ED71